MAYDGGYTAFLEKQAERLANEAERERGRRAFVRRELDWIRRGPQARTTKQQARIDRNNNVVGAVVVIAVGIAVSAIDPDGRGTRQQARAVPEPFAEPR